ncbi:hypothetical protein Y699_06944 [Aspergillus fumigatus Z5]|nr:hypothetical protein Y699_06944 [Aspergillus fumigatus Z5]
MAGILMACRSSHLTYSSSVAKVFVCAVGKNEVGASYSKTATNFPFETTFSSVENPNAPKSIPGGHAVQNSPPSSATATPSMTMIFSTIYQWPLPAGSGAICTWRGILVSVSKGLESARNAPSRREGVSGGGSGAVHYTDSIGEQESEFDRRHAGMANSWIVGEIYQVTMAGWYVSVQMVTKIDRLIPEKYSNAK